MKTLRCVGAERKYCTIHKSIFQLDFDPGYLRCLRVDKGKSFHSIYYTLHCKIWTCCYFEAQAYFVLGENCVPCKWATALHCPPPLFPALVATRRTIIWTQTTQSLKRKVSFCTDKVKAECVFLMVQAALQQHAGKWYLAISGAGSVHVAHVSEASPNTKYKYFKSTRSIWWNKVKIIMR